MPKRHGGATNDDAHAQHELEPEALAWLAAGGWSAFGVACSTQARPLTVVGDAVFYLQHPQVWVIQELFTDEGVFEANTPFGGKA